MIGFLLRTLCAFAATLIAGYYILGGISSLAWISAGTAAFAAANMAAVNRMISGHGVDGSRHILDMPVPMLVIYLVFLGVALFLALATAFGLPPATIAGSRALGLGFFFGWAGGVLDWYAASRERTWYLSESNERIRLELEGLHAGWIDTRIENMRSMGKFPPKAK